MRRLRILGHRDEVLLFRALGIEAYVPGQPCALLLGRQAQAPDEEDMPWLRLPDPETPLGETQRLAGILGRAVGQGRVRL